MHTYARKNDKVGIALAMLFILLTSVSIYSIAESRTSDLRSDIVTEDASAVDNFAIHMNLVNISAATNTVLIDKSDTTNFPHKFTGDIEVQQIRVDWTTNGVSSTTIKVGVIASTSASGALTDIYWFDQVAFDSLAAGARQSRTIDYSPGIVSLARSGASTTKMLSNDYLLASSAYATTTALSSPMNPSGGMATVNPGTGDLILQVYGQVGAATSSITVLGRIR